MDRLSRKRQRGFVWSLLFLAALLVLPGQGWAQKLDVGISSFPDKVLAKFKSDVRADKMTGKSFDAMNQSLGAYGATVAQDFKQVGITSLAVANGASARDVIAKLKDSGLVEYAEPDYVVQAFQVQPLSVPDDPQFNILWGMHNVGQSGGKLNADIDAPEAWNVHTGNKNLVIAVIDTGVDYDHPDLKANMWTNPSEIPNNGIDDDGNGYIDDVYGINTYASPATGDPKDDNSHGTHVAGTIGAVGNNGVGVVGVNWTTQILACKFLGASGSGAVSGAVACLDYIAALKNKGINIKVTNNSWGGGGYSQALKDAITTQASLGILFVAAAGNSANNNDANPSYPASYAISISGASTNIIAVAATDKNDNMATFSNYGAGTVHLGAPGVDILSTTPGSSYGSKSGTSMAAPHVTGAVALAWSLAANQSKSYGQIRNLILNTTDAVNALQGKTTTGGRLNARVALTCNNSTTLTMNISSPAPGFTATANTATVVKADLLGCFSGVTGATVTVTPFGGTAITMKDDGVSPDVTANDGIYAANWTPTSNGAMTLEVKAVSGSATVIKAVSGTVSSGYTVNTSGSYSFIDIASTGTSVGLSSDSINMKTITIPFTFSYFGKAYTSINVHTYGYLSFGPNSSCVCFVPSKIPSNIPPNGVLAPFWDDILAGGTTAGLSTSDTKYEVQGTAPNRKLIIQYNDARRYYDTQTTSSRVTFQVILSEGTNAIKFQYKDVIFGGTQASFDKGAKASVGIENETGNDGKQAISFQTAGLSDGQAIEFTLGAVSTPPTMNVTPATPLYSTGNEGGSFSPSSVVYTVSNTGGQDMDYTVTSNQPWVTLSSTGGTLGAGGTQNITVTINSNANFLKFGDYSANIMFQNTTNGKGTTARAVNLAIKQVKSSGTLSVTPSTGLTASGAMGGPFTPPNLSMTLAADSAGSVAYTVAKKTNAPWLALSTFGGILPTSGSTSLNVLLNANAVNLPPGTYTETLVFTNTTNGQGNTTRSVTLTVTAPAGPGKLKILPQGGQVFTANAGGTVAVPPDKTYTLFNTGNTVMSYEVTTTEPWISLTNPSGNLAAGDKVSVAVSIDTSKIATLSPGDHKAEVFFSNENDGQGNATMQMLLHVLPQHIVSITSGPSGTPNPVEAGGTVNMTVGADDSFKHTLAYAWTSSCPGNLAGTFANASIASPVWTSPANVTAGESADCTITVTVSDGQVTPVTGSYIQKVQKRTGRRVFSPYWQEDSDSYTFLGVSHPSLRKMASMIGVKLTVMKDNGSDASTLFGGQDFTIQANKTQRIFIVRSNDKILNPTFMPSVYFVTDTLDALGYLTFTPIATDTEALSSEVLIAAGKGGSRDILNLIYWGAIVTTNATGFAMEFVGE